MREVREGLIKGDREVGEGTDGRRDGFAEERWEVDVGRRYGLGSGEL